MGGNTPHITTLTKFDTVVRNNWFGGGSHLVMKNVKVFDSLIGGTRSMPGSLIKFDILTQ